MASSRRSLSPGPGPPAHSRKASTSSPAAGRLSLHSLQPTDGEGALASPGAARSGRSGRGSSPSAVEEGAEALPVQGQGQGQGGAATPPHVHVRNSTGGDATATPKEAKGGVASPGAKEGMRVTGGDGVNRRSSNEDKSRVIIGENASMVLKMTGGMETKGLGSTFRRISGLSVDTHNQPTIAVSTKEPYKSGTPPQNVSNGEGTYGSGPAVTPSSRRSFIGGFIESRRKSTEAASKHIRSSITLPLSADLSQRVQQLLAGAPDSGELLRCLCLDDASAKRSLSETEAKYGSESEESLKCGLRAVFESPSYQKLSAVKDSLARVYVLTTAKHLLSSLLRAKEALASLTVEGDADMRTFPAMLSRTLEALTALNPRTVTSGGGGGGPIGVSNSNNPTTTTPGGPTGGNNSNNPGGGGNGGGPTGRARPSAGGGGATSELIAGFLYRSPVPCLVARYFRDVPMLSHAFVALAQTSLRVLVAADNAVRRLMLENAPRYFYSSVMLKKDLDIVWQHVSLGSLYMEYYGHLSRDVFMAGLLPYHPLTKLEVFSLISIGIAKHKLMLERQHAAAAAATPTAPTTTTTGGPAPPAPGPPRGPPPPTTPPAPPASTVTSVTSPNGAVSTTLLISAPPPHAAEMDPDTLAVVQKAFLSEEPFRCSPFLVTFAHKTSDPRPKYEHYGTRDEAAYPALLLSLSRQLFVGRCTPESLEEYFHTHYELVQDYLTCSDVPRIIDSALAESGPLPLLMARGGAKWTFNLYADMVVADFTTRFYMDFHRKVSSSSSSEGAVLAFSSRFAELQKPTTIAGLKELLGLPATGPADAAPSQSPLGKTGASMKDLFSTSGAVTTVKNRGVGYNKRPPLSVQLGPDVATSEDPGQGSNYILLVSERLVESLRVADALSGRDLICACAMAEAMVVWYVLWARASLNRSVAGVSKAAATWGEGSAMKEATVFEALRRVCALCSDVNSIARYCTNLIRRIRTSIEEGKAGVLRGRTGTPTTPHTPHGQWGFGPTPVNPLSPASRVNRKGFILSPANKAGTGKGGMGNSGRTPRNAGGGGGGESGPASPNTPASRRGQGPGGSCQQPGLFEGTPCSALEAGGDMSAYDVIVNDLVAMVGDLALLSAQCLEHACEIATHMTRRICKEQLGKAAKGKGGVTSFFKGGKQSSPRRGAVDASGGGGGNGPSAANNRPTAEPLNLNPPPLSPQGSLSPNAEVRLWARDLVTSLFRPLGEFCRKDELCSSVVLPRLVEGCLHSVLDVLGGNGKATGRVSMAEARLIHGDFMYLKAFLVNEASHHSPRAMLASLPVLDRMHVVVNVLQLPPSLSMWGHRELAALYLLPDAPRWVGLRSDRGRVSTNVLANWGRGAEGRVKGGEEAGEGLGQQLSDVVAVMDTSRFDKAYAAFESARSMGGNEGGK